MLHIKTNPTEYDVIVIGGGPSGCASAWASANCGAKTLLIESSGALGGMATMGLVTSWAPFSDQEKMIYRGFAKTVFEKSRSAMPNVAKDALDWVPISPEALKVIYDEELKNVNVEVEFFAMAVGVEMNGGKIEKIYVAKKDGVHEYKAKVFIDCTGDANIVAFAGAPFEMGGENRELQPATLCFVVANIDMNALKGVNLSGYNDNSPIREIIQSDKYPLITQSHFCVDFLADGIISFNAGHIFDSDGTDPKCVSDAITRGRKLAEEYHRAFKDTMPKAFGKSFLIATAPMLGIRETRRIKGKYIFTIKDYLERRTFEDEISRNCYYIDLHQAHSSCELPELDKKYLSLYQKGESHGIPYRCLVPLGTQNLLVAGRAISCDRLSNASLRVMPNCLTTGEAAGVAAYLACKNNVSVDDIDIKELRKILKENGAYFM